MDSINKPGVCLPETLASFLFLCLYSFIVPPMGGYINGGQLELGMGFLVVACLSGWRAFVVNTRSPWFRRLVQMPLVIAVSYEAIQYPIVLFYKSFL